MHERFMRRAIELAMHNVHTAVGGPFGAIVVCNGEIVAEGVNLVTATNDPTAHAEVVAIRRACERLARFELRGCAMYSSCEPCPMCLGAIYWARLERLWFACTRADAAEAGFDDSFLYDEMPRSIGERSLATGVLLRDEGIAAMLAWVASEKKVPY
jgi:tRNA(Arg) A34 adenosine deaminase TadA